jgi:hypothetical protein
MYPGDKTASNIEISADHELKKRYQAIGEEHFYANPGKHQGDNSRFSNNASLSVKVGYKNVQKARKRMLRAARFNSFESGPEEDQVSRRRNQERYVQGQLSPGNVAQKTRKAVAAYYEQRSGREFMSDEVGITPGRMRSWKSKRRSQMKEKVKTT